MDNLHDLTPEFASADDLTASSGVEQIVPEVISHRYLYRAIAVCCTDDNERLLVPKPVRKLIARCAPEDRPTMNEIPQERRRSFLKELTSITGRPLPPRERDRAESSFDQLIRGVAAPAREQPLSPKMTVRSEPTLVSDDETLINNGYEQIAVNGKVPVVKGWNKRPSTKEAVAAERSGHPVRAIPGCALDVSLGSISTLSPPSMCSDQASRCRSARAHLARARRCEGRDALLSQRDPSREDHRLGKHAAQPAKIEILGAGQQFVSYGIHPEQASRTRGRTPRRRGTPATHSIHSPK